MSKSHFGVSGLSGLSKMAEVAPFFTDLLPIPSIPSMSDIRSGFNTEKSEEYTASKKVLSSLMTTAFRQNWQWAVHITDLQEKHLPIAGGGETTTQQFMTFGKDISFGRFSLESESYTVGSVEIFEPIKRSAGTVTITLRDDEDNTMAKHFAGWGASVFNKDGTQKIPSEYVRMLHVKALDSNGVESDDVSWAVYPSEVGDVSLAYEATASFSVFTVTFQKVRSLGAFPLSPASKPD